MSKDKELVKKASTDISTEVVDFDFGEIDKTDIKLSRAQIVQDPQEGQKIGQIIDNLTLEVLPEKFIPCFFYYNWVKFNADFKLEWMTFDKSDPRTAEAEFGEDGTKPEAMKCINIIALFEGKNVPVIITFAKTSYNAGKQLLNMIYAGKCSGTHPCARKYALTTELKDYKATKKYGVYKVVPAGSSSEEEFVKAEKINSEVKGIYKDVEKKNYEDIDVDIDPKVQDEIQF